MAINRISREIKAMDNIVRSDDKTDVYSIDVSSYRTKNNEVLTFVYNINEETSVDRIVYTLRQIYEIFTEDPRTEKLWGYLIERFETKFDIDFLMFISYVYMKNMENIGNTDSRKLRTIAQVIATLIREVGYDIKVGEDIV